MIVEGGRASRDWARYVLGLARHADPDCELALCGDAWRVESRRGPPRVLCGVEVAQVVY